MMLAEQTTVACDWLEERSVEEATGKAMIELSQLR